ncbi:MAG: nucleoside kinase [Clostridia bacterium]|nr:nucleoside kinase [Clostridia bacterium]
MIGMKSVNKIYTFNEINRLALEPRKFLSDCSADYHARVSETAEIILSDESRKLVMLAGPSSSGKTTTARLLSEKLVRMGAAAYTVSLDDFYHPRSVGYPLDENGKPDYECVEALDIELMHECFGNLLKNGRAEFPVFDFHSGERINNAKKVELSEKGVIIVEGLHALNPVITETLDEKSLYRIYVSVSSRVYDENGDVLFSKRDLRFVRRMVRDYSFRSTSVDRTFEIWQSVMRGEDKYLFPYERNADIKLNSFHPCEPCVLSEKAIRLLRTATDGEHREKAELMIDKLGLFRNTDYSILPENSLLREFTG